MVGAFLDEHPQFSAEDLLNGHPGDGAGPYMQLLPHRDHTDGFFIARIRRR